jgi:hypothetical protein
MFDDSFYLSATEEGGLIPLSKDVDGNLHCFGGLVVAPKELQHKVFKQVAEEISRIKNNPIIILVPLPRYRDQPCCNNPEHMANRGKTEFSKTLDESVYQSRVNFKDFAFRYGLRNVRTVGTWSSVKRMAQPWADQIHLTGEGYSLIARAMVEAIEELKKKRSGGEAVEAPKAKRPRQEDSLNSRGGNTGLRGGVRGSCWTSARGGNQSQGSMHGRGGGWSMDRGRWNRGQHRRVAGAGRRHN